MNNTDRNPFLYVIGWTELNAWYVGVKWAKGCCPLDLWTRYFTSSKAVADIREWFGEPDVVEVLAVGNADDVLSLETYLLEQFDAIHNPSWLNRNVRGTSFKSDGHSIEARANMSAAALSRPEVSEVTRQKLREGALSPASRAAQANNLVRGGKGNLGKTLSEETRAKMSAAKKGRPLSDKHKEALRAAKSKTSVPPNK